MYPFQKIHGTEQPNTSQSKNAQTRVWLFGFVLLVIILAGLMYLQEINKKKNFYKRTDALSGLLVNGFPNSLLLNFKDPKIRSSYSLNYSKDRKQYTTVFSLKENFFLVYEKYKTYLKQNSYYLANDQIDAREFKATLYGFSNDSDINVQIFKKSEDFSNLNITYLKKGGE